MTEARQGSGGSYDQITAILLNKQAFYQRAVRNEQKSRLFLLIPLS
jgi:hypothetical protein